MVMLGLGLGEFQSREVRESFANSFHRLIVISPIPTGKPKAYKGTQTWGR